MSCETGDRLGARLQDRSDSEVREYHPVRIPLLHHVARLYIPVDDSALVGGRQRRGYLAQSMTGLLDRHDPLCLEHICEVPALDVLHDDEWRPALERADPMHGRDVVMVDLRSGSSLPFESLPSDVILGQLRLHELDCDQTLERPLPSTGIPVPQSPRPASGESGTLGLTLPGAGSEDPVQPWGHPSKLEATLVSS